MYVKLKNGVIEKYPYSTGELQRDHPQTSFPAGMPAAMLATFGVFPVEPVPAPSADHTKQVIEGPPVNNGGWKQTWRIVDAPPAEVTNRVNYQAQTVRGERDRLLAACDWTQLPDSKANTAAWAVYRQALRDITKQAGFPWTVVWPTPPV